MIVASARVFAGSAVLALATAFASDAYGCGCNFSTSTLGEGLRKLAKQDVAFKGIPVSSKHVANDATEYTFRVETCVKGKCGKYESIIADELTSCGLGHLFSEALQTGSSYWVSGELISKTKLDRRPQYFATACVSVFERAN